MFLCIGVFKERLVQLKSKHRVNIDWQIHIDFGEHVLIEVLKNSNYVRISHVLTFFWRFGGQLSKQVVRKLDHCPAISQCLQLNRPQLQVEGILCIRCRSPVNLLPGVDFRSGQWIPILPRSNHYRTIMRNWSHLKQLP